MTPTSEIADLRRARTGAIKAAAKALGFDAVGVAAAGPADPAGHLATWLDRGFGAGMGYMARTAAERADPSLLVADARSVIALAMSYYTAESPAPTAGKIARYARGDDYHRIIQKKVRKLRRQIIELVPQASVHPAVDTSPVLEREWAHRAGVAWIGKSTMAIGQKLGTYTFLATLITNVELDVDAAHPDRCGSCTACVDACPTDAFVGPYELDARRCITYWNVEHRAPIPEGAPAPFGWLAGCDVCQEVCPWNKFAAPTREPRFSPRPELVSPDLARIAADPGYAAGLIRGTALQRTGGEAMQRNAQRLLDGGAA